MENQHTASSSEIEPRPTNKGSGNYHPASSSDTEPRPTGIGNQHTASSSDTELRPAEADGTAKTQRRPWQKLRNIYPWFPEIAALFAAAALVAAIVIILLGFDGQQLPQWPYSINLNTLIALLTLCLRTALALVAAEIISQSKWMWFSDKPRSLAGFQTFDEASRGLLGSFKLISLLRLSWRGSPLAVMAAITSILSLAISPFAQQAIKTFSCPRVVSSDGARIPVAMHLPGEDSGYWYASTLGYKTQGAIFSGLTNPSGNESNIQVQCSTGNCTFPETLGVPHSTIGLCARCLDTTSLVKVSERVDPEDRSLTRGKNSSVAMLNDMMLSVKDYGSILKARSEVNYNLSFADSLMTPEFDEIAAKSSIANFSIMTFTELKDQHCRNGTLNASCVVAASCSLYPCMKKFRASVVNGRIQESIVEEVPSETNRTDLPADNYDYHHDRVMIKSPCLVNGQIYDETNFSSIRAEDVMGGARTIPVYVKRRDSSGRSRTTNMNVPYDCLYTVDGHYVIKLARFVHEQLFSGSCTTHEYMERGSLDCNQTWWLHQLYNHGNSSYDFINNAVQEMVKATTNFYRIEGWNPGYEKTYRGVSPFPTEFPKAFIKGKIQESTVCMRLEKPWLLLPVILCLTTIALLAAMVFVNATHSHPPVWKSSALPLLFFGLDGRAPHREEASDGPCADDLASMGRQAKRTTVYLDADGGLSRTALVALDGADWGDSNERLREEMS
ncbi:hypothetical protein CDD80_5234 [Ophiocordyceps camponoti-rufipedis]|uniref:Uncharacterized protein n=1 Tax=Ophiocordyceps camponoti-rufipedis TaxID=2004952 RepID=A0A2C5XGF5_9HYPO|nr:hypothetical protein CDD80_5234 [Ophiocordyceps camponoti-rufipedis]